MTNYVKKTFLGKLFDNFLTIVKHVEFSPKPNLFYALPLTWTVFKWFGWETKRLWLGWQIDVGGRPALVNFKSTGSVCVRRKVQTRI